MIKKITLILIIGFILRILFFEFYLQHNPLMTSFDSGHYHSLAQSLANGNGYTDSQNTPYFYRLPGYPLFLATSYSFLGDSPITALWVQVALSSLIPLLIFFITQLLFPHQSTIHLITTLFAIFHPGYLIYSGLMMSETLFVLLFLLFTLALFMSLKSHSSWHILTCGFFLGLASLIRPVGHLLLPLVISFFLFNHNSLSKRLFQGGLISLAWLGTVSWWLIRNYQLTGMIFFHTLGGPHFLNHCGIKLLMKQQSIPYSQARDLAYQEIDKLITQQEIKLKHPLLQIEETQVMESYTKNLMLTNIPETLKLFTINWLKTMFGLYSSELLVIESNGQLPSYENQISLAKKIYRFLMPKASLPIILFIYYEILFFIIILIGSLLGFYYFFQHNPDRAKIILAFIVCFIFLSLGCGFARMRLPIEHFFIMLTSVFLIKVVSKRG